MRRMLAMLPALPVMAMAAVPGDTFERALAALRAGGPRAAALLDAVGAHPIEGPDAVAAWRGPAMPAAYRDRVLGPGYVRVALDGGGSYRLEQSFLAGQRARVAAFATPAADFDLTVRDEDGTRRCAANGGNAVCDWVPVYTSRVAIALANRNRQRATFFVMLQ